MGHPFSCEWMPRIIGALADAGAFFYGDGDLFDDLQAEAFEGGDMHGGVGEETDALDTEVGKNLAAQPDGAEDAAGAGLGAFTGAQFLMEDEAGGGGVRSRDGEDRAARLESCLGCGRVVDLESAGRVVEVEQDAATLFSNAAHGLVEDFAAGAVGGEDVAGGAARVDADEDGVRAVFVGCSWAVVECGAAGAEVAANEGDVAFAAVDFRLVGDHAEFTVAGLDAGFAGADDVALVAQAIADEFGDGKNLEAVLGAERDEVRNAGHFAVVAHDFANHAGGVESSHAGQVDGGFGLAGADEHSPFAGAEGKDVAGAGEVAGGGLGIDGGADSVGAVGGGDAGGDAFASFNGLSEGGAEARGVVLGHGEEAQIVGALLGEGEADEAATVAGHEVDGFGGDVFGGEGEVAFVFAVFVVDHDHHAAGADFGEGSGDVGEGRRNNTVFGGARGVGHKADSILTDSGRENKAPAAPTVRPTASRGD
jgi:hypothetical protein